MFAEGESLCAGCMSACVQQDEADSATQVIRHRKKIYLLCFVMKNFLFSCTVWQLNNLKKY